jgi:hypothetical protein
MDPFADLGLQEEEEEEEPKDKEQKSSSSTHSTPSRTHEEPDEHIVEQLVSMGFLRPCAYRCTLATQQQQQQSCKSTPPPGDPFSLALEHALEHSEDPGMNDPLPGEEEEEKEEEGKEKVEHNNKNKKNKPRNIPLELQRLFCQLQVAGGCGVQRQAVSTQELTSRGFQWTSGGGDGSVQHDAHELNRLVSQ